MTPVPRWEEVGPVWMAGQALALAPAIRPEVNLSALTLCVPDARRAIREPVPLSASKS